MTSVERVPAGCRDGLPTWVVQGGHIQGRGREAYTQQDSLSGGGITGPGYMPPYVHHPGYMPLCTPPCVHPEVYHPVYTLRYTTRVYTTIVHCWSVLNVRKVRKARTAGLSKRLKDTSLANVFLETGIKLLKTRSTLWDTFVNDRMHIGHHFDHF